MVVCSELLSFLVAKRPSVRTAAGVIAAIVLVTLIACGDGTPDIEATVEARIAEEQADEAAKAAEIEAGVVATMVAQTAYTQSPNRDASNSSAPRMSWEQYLDFTKVNDIQGAKLDSILDALTVSLFESPHDRNLQSHFVSIYTQWNDITNETISIVPPTEFLKSHDLAIEALRARRRAYVLILENINAGRPPLASDEELKEYETLLVRANLYMMQSVDEFINAAQR